MSFAFRLHMFPRAPILAVLTGFLVATCGPTLPPTNAPPQPDPRFDALGSSLQAYIDLTQPYRKQAAEVGENVPGQTKSEPASADAVRARQNSLADALRTKLRPTAKQGDILTTQMAASIKEQLDAVFKSERRHLIFDELAEQNSPPAKGTPAVNQQMQAPRVPPRLMEVLPPLPKQLEYDFAGRTLILRDVDADVVVDFLPNALPEAAPSGVPTTAPKKVDGAGSALPMPQMRGGTIFAVLGDSGSGDQAQTAVAQAMVNYFTYSRRFPFVLMLGDNLYHDDYEGDFLEPYKPLLDRGVRFYAAIGNHDRDLQIHFKPFNMGDKDRYSFDDGNARFVALNSNHPGDPEQIKWLDTVYTDAGEKWRIAFFHHPLYSSGQHAAESRQVIRPALEEFLVRNRVNVAFTGHEHLYERVKPQQGVNYFVSGGGGRYLYSVKKSEFDEVAVSDHHFMVVEIAGDRLFFEAITRANKVMDCGVIMRASNIKADDTTTKWLEECEAAKPDPVKTH
jgi:hypothetical protein